MKISVILASYNSGRSICTALESIKTQSLHEVEIISIDGNSKDNTVSIIKKFGVDILVSESDKGIYDALNKGVRCATGEVIGFVHSDDFLASSDVLKNIETQFLEKDVDGVYGDLVYVDKEDSDKVIRYWKSRPYKPELLKKGWMPPHPTLFLKRKVYEKYGLFDLSFKIAGDYDFMLRIFQDPDLKFAYLPEVITKMRVGGASNRSLENIIQKSKEDYRALKKNHIFFPIRALLYKNISKIPQFLKKTNKK